ncbi:hypothetical protein WMF11_27230 [Sorangium sp. So ce295]|uniref:hypothetical protein n=1 Tax=Sorangium sp. So ce295 TaxID=3133295 RepID=UPI003F63C893
MHLRLQPRLRPRPSRAIATSPPPRLRRTIFLALAFTTLLFTNVAWAQATWASPECADAGLESPAGTCDGPWRYSWRRLCQDPAICGYSGVCANYNSCKTYGAGINESNIVERPSTQYTSTCQTTYGGPNDGLTTCPPDTTTICSNLATNRKNEIRSSVVPTTGPNYSTWLSRFNVQPRTVILSDRTTQSGGFPLERIRTITYRCELNITSFPQPNTGPAPECGCHDYRPNECACETGTTLTTPSPNAPAPTAPSGPGQTFPPSSPPVCLTCDDPDFVADSDAHAMAACLVDKMAGAPAHVAQAQAARLKLVLELAAHRLSASERAQIELLYSSSAGAPACQLPLALDPACAASAVSPSGMNIASQLQLCADLDAAHVPVEAVRAELPHCLDVLAELPELPESACRETLLAVGAEIVATLIERTTSTYSAAGGLEDDLLESLRHLDAWYSAVAAIGDPGWVRAQSGALAGRIWERAHEAAEPLPANAGSDAAAAALLADVAASGLAVDWAMLRAAFHPSKPIASPPLLFIVGDALRGTLDRLQQVSPIHDVACRFAGCAPTAPGGAPLATPASEAWRALAAIDDAGALADVLAHAGALGSQQPALVAALAALVQQHAALAEAWSRAGGSSLAALADPNAEVPIEAEGLAALVRAARGAATSYAATGLIAASPARLSSAVLKREQLVGYIDYGVSAVDGAADDFAAARLATTNDLLAQTRAAGETRSVLDRVASQVHEARALLGRLDGLRSREASEHAAIGDFMSAFEAVIASGAFDADTAYQVDTLPPVEISPDDARFPVGGELDLPSMHAAVVTLLPGEILDVDMPDRTWTPTCALDLSQIASPTGAAADIDVLGAVAGPEGYYITWSNTHYEADGVNQSHTQIESSLEMFERCTGFSASWPPSIPDLPSSPLVASTTERRCTSESWGTTDSYGTSHTLGTDARMSASFNGGLRLPIVPVPAAPVGSLLAVLTLHDQPDVILDVRVVNPRDAIQAPAVDPAMETEIDVHFLVNDVTGACARPTADSLLLSMRVITPVGLVARSLGAGMARTIDAIEAQASDILAQGGMTSQDAGALRADAWSRLTLLLAAQGNGLQGLPVELKNLYEAWIEKEIASLGRRGEIHRVQHDIVRIGLDLLALEHELSNTEAESRLLRLIPRWRLRDLAGVELRPAIESLREILSDYAAPIFQLRDPAGLGGLRASAAGQLAALLGVSFAAPLDEVADDLRRFAVRARNSLVAAQFELPSDARRTVVVAFPRDPGACQGLCDEFRSASEQASERAWRGIEQDGHVAELAVQAADLYAFSGGNARLSCHDVAPVVRRASVYMLNPVNTSIDFTALGRELPAVAGAGAARFSFPRVGGVLELTADTEAGVPLSLPVINGPGGDVLSDFGASNELGAGAGISPFTTFSVDFTSFYTDPPATFIDETLAVLLVLEVERRVNTGLSFVPAVCQNSVNLAGGGLIEELPPQLPPEEL